MQLWGPRRDPVLSPHTQILTGKSKHASLLPRRVCEIMRYGLPSAAWRSAHSHWDSYCCRMEGKRAPWLAPCLLPARSAPRWVWEVDTEQPCSQGQSPQRSQGQLLSQPHTQEAWSQQKVGLSLGPPWSGSPAFHYPQWTAPCHPYWKEADSVEAVGMCSEHRNTLLPGPVREAQLASS